MTPGTPDLGGMREEYHDRPLHETDLAPDWQAQFGRWFADAVEAGEPEPNAMVLATATPDGRPSARTVLLKGYDERGLVFFTSLESRKGRELAANPYACLVFRWLTMHRQLVVCGTAEQVDRAQTQVYFATRPRESQLGAWASPQSRIVESRSVLDEEWAEADRRFPDGVPTPLAWGGLRVVPETVEFWQGRVGRLHDRLRFRREPAVPAGWVVERLAP